MTKGIWCCEYVWQRDVAWFGTRKALGYNPEHDCELYREDTRKSLRQGEPDGWESLVCLRNKESWGLESWDKRKGDRLSLGREAEPYWMWWKFWSLYWKQWEIHCRVFKWKGMIDMTYSDLLWKDWSSYSVENRLVWGKNGSKGTTGSNAVVQMKEDRAWNKLVTLMERG